MNKSVKNIARTVAIAGVAAFAIAAQPAAAAPLEVSATVTENCDVTASPIAFGNVDSRSSSNTDQASTISVTCTSGTNYDVAADKGAGGATATITSRKMASGANLLNYALYTDTGRTIIWGDGSTGNGAKLTGIGDGSAQTVNFYGRVPGGQTTVPGGAYSDT